MYLSKKGIETNTLIGLIILVIITGIFLAVIFPLIRDTAESSTSKEVCRTSVLANAKRIEFAGEELTPGLSEINCPTQKLEVKDPNKIKLVIANQMYDCWDKFGRGRVKFLDPETGTYCIICSRIKFKDEASGKEISGFSSFLAENKIRDDNGNPIPGINITYLQFLAPFETKIGELEKLKEIESQDIIDTNYDYAIMFNYYKKDKDGRPVAAEKSVLASAIGCFSVAAAGAGFIIFSGGSALVVLPAAGVFFKGCSVILGTAGAGAGWVFGSDYAADWAARVITLPYQDIDKLGCTSLE